MAPKAKKSAAQVEKERAAERERWAALTPEQKDAERHENFRRLASKRMPKVLASIASIGKLSKPNYRYTDAEVNAILGALQGAVDGVVAQFTTTTEQAAGFELPTE